MKRFFIQLMGIICVSIALQSCKNAHRTHPDIADRIQRIEEQIKETEKPAGNHPSEKSNEASNKKISKNSKPLD